MLRARLSAPIFYFVISSGGVLLAPQVVRAGRPHRQPPGTAALQIFSRRQLAAARHALANHGYAKPPTPR